MPDRASTWLQLFDQYERDHRHPLNHACHLVGVPMIVAGVLMAPLRTLWPWALGLEIVGWGLNFVGHGIEGTRPAFSRDPRMLIVSPIYFVWKHWPKKS